MTGRRAAGNRGRWQPATTGDRRAATRVPAESLRRAAAIASAAVIAIGVTGFGWPAFAVRALYWLQNVNVGVFAALRLVAAAVRTRRYGETLFALPFFVVYCGPFCLAHGLVVAVFFGAIDDPTACSIRSSRRAGT